MPKDQWRDTGSKLVDEARKGNRAAFNSLIRRYRTRIFSTALQILGDESEADDVTQEALLRAWRAMEQFEGRSDFFTWLYRIVLNLSFNALRSRKARPKADLEDPRLQYALTVDSEGDPRRAAELAQIYVRLLHALDGLSPTLRATVVLVALQGLSQAEAAIVLRSTPGTVAWRMHEARGKLRVALEAYERAPETRRKPSSS